MFVSCVCGTKENCPGEEAGCRAAVGRVGRPGHTKEAS